jgi:hypothetical protein
MKKAQLDSFIKDKATTVDEYNSLRNEINLYLNESMFFIDLSTKAKDILIIYSNSN